MTRAAENCVFLKMETFIRGGREVRVSRYHCQVTKAAMMRRETTMRVGIQGVDQPTTLPSVRAKRRTRMPTVMRTPPIQSTEAREGFTGGVAVTVGLSSVMVGGGWAAEGGGMTKRLMTAMMPETMAITANTHFQVVYSAMKPATRFPKTAPRGAPAAVCGGGQTC